jgi:GNAT superfamily N-acetyltransferase
MRIAPLTTEIAEAWSALFAACGCACHCRYWHFGGNKNEWLARCFGEPERNREEQLALVRQGAFEARGLVALDGDVAVGWMKLAPRGTLAKLRRQGAYRGLDLGPDDGVYSIGCFLVHPAHRRRGIAGALVAAADEQVRAWTGRAIEAYPHRPGYALRDEEAWMGPERIFVEKGYAVVHDDGPYPVYRKDL